MIRHVQAVSILLIVQGVLELLMSAYYLFMGPMAALMGFFVPQDPGGPPPLLVFGAAGVVVAGIGLGVITSAILKIAGGVSGLSMKRRGLGMAGLIAGALTLPTCYCVPTALGIGIYGLIVYLNDEVVEGFERVKLGETPLAVRRDLEVRGQSLPD